MKSLTSTQAPDPTSAESMARLLAERYVGRHDLFRLWEKHGFHVTPAHFYSPVPTLADLSDDMWTKVSELPGIELNEVAQIEFLERICPRFKAEYDAFPDEPTEPPYQYYFNQMMFRAVDAEVLYCIIRHHQPRRVVEVGSGFSTLITAAACSKNAEEGHPADLIAIEPYPNDILHQDVPGLTRLIPMPVQHVDRGLLTALSAGDVLFIDSSHVVRLGSDVNYLILEILPSLQAGVLVHFHDIFLPLEYPRQWVMEEHRFWSEQYLLQAFLAHNRSFEVLWAASYMRLHHGERLHRAFAHYDPATVWPASLWIRRVGEEG